MKRAGCKLLYLPPYSPDFNPIEKVWSWLKNWVRRKSRKHPKNARPLSGRPLRPCRPTWPKDGSNAADYDNGNCYKTTTHYGRVDYPAQVIKNIALSFRLEHK